MASEEPSSGGGHRSPSLSPCILIVDDGTANVDLLEAYLVPEGYAILKAYNGVEALELVTASPPDLILLDVMMPQLDGYEVCHRLKSDEATVFIPIVMITALQEVEEKIKGIEMGADDFLSKPFNKVELLTRVRSLLRVKALHDQLEASKRLLEFKVKERTAQLEEALASLRQLDQLKTEFLSTVSHELWTPLTPIKGYLQAVLEETLGPLSPSQRNSLEIVTENVTMLEALIGDLLAYVRMESGALKLTLEPLPLDSLFQSLTERLQPQATQKGITLTTALPPDLPSVLADLTELERALLHLLGNAVKFTPAGGTVSLEAQPVSPAASGPTLVQISVRDTGIGLPADRIPKIFDRFYQVDGSTTREYGGMGIGLAIVKQIIAAHGSTVGVESRVGEGSTFSFVLPISR